MREIPFSPPDISKKEIDKVTEVLKSGWITTGPNVRNFEQAISSYCNTKISKCLNSATACMELCLRVLGVGPGDEVITSAYTYTASASVIHHVGAKIVLVDTDPESYHLSYSQLEKAITDKTKVIIPVDIAGIMCDYDRIFEIIEEKKNLFTANNEIQEKFNRIIVLADAAHSFGATYNGYKSGEIADFTSFSFHAVKNLTTSEGGALTWKSLGNELDLAIYNELNILSLHGQTKDAFSKNQLGAWEYDIVYPAYKCNMTDIQAAIGLAQLERYNDFLKKRLSLITHYKEKFLELPINFEEHHYKNSHSSMHLLLSNVALLNVDRDIFITKLAEQGVSTNVHYKPLPMLSAYKNLGFRIEDFPNSFNMFKNEITFPLYTTLCIEDIDYIYKVIRGVIKD